MVDANENPRAHKNRVGIYKLIIERERQCFRGGGCMIALGFVAEKCPNAVYNIL